MSPSFPSSTMAAFLSAFQAHPGLGRILVPDRPSGSLVSPAASRPLQALNAQRFMTAAKRMMEDVEKARGEEVVHSIPDQNGQWQVMKFSPGPMAAFEHTDGRFVRLSVFSRNCRIEVGVSRPYQKAMMHQTIEKGPTGLRLLVPHYVLSVDGPGLEGLRNLLFLPPGAPLDAIGAGIYASLGLPGRPRFDPNPFRDFDVSDENSTHSEISSETPESLIRIRMGVTDLPRVTLEIFPKTGQAASLDAQSLEFWRWIAEEKVVEALDEPR